MRPPCKSNGVLCPRFTPGCRKDCDEYREWNKRHLEEKAAKDAMKNAIRDMDEFIAGSIARLARRR